MRILPALKPFCFGLTAYMIFAASAGAADKVTFNKDIRPILSDKCFACHGPDRTKLKGDLSLSVRDDAIARAAITPGKPDESEMLRRILSDDPDEHMPPASAKLGSLTSQEIETLRKWIEQGAEYENHWSFISLDPAVLDGAKSSPEVSGRIDQIVASGLAVRGLSHQPEADRNTLIRRLSFDITGLPPSVADVEAFVADQSPDAVEKLVDRLLASPQYGERMAVDWLDTARYADSYGFQVDRERDMWPWRDWVIKAFNDNKPFDQFITEQLAGDLLPNATDDQILATAFNRLHQQESEGGSVEEEYRVEYVCDRVQTFATAFLGLTFECARCHDHKYDPITQKEYYQLFWMFQNIDEAGLYSYFTPSPPTPALTLADANQKARVKELSDAIAAVEAKTDQIRSGRGEAFAAWLNAPERTTAELKLPELGRFSFDVQEGSNLANAVAADKPATIHGENKLVEGKNGNAVAFTGDDPVNLPFGNFRREEPFAISLWLKTPDVKDRAVVFHRSRAWTDAASRGYELLIEDGRLKWSLIHFWPGNAMSIQATAPLIPNEWTHVVVSSDGSSRAAGLKMLINGKPAEITIVRDALTREITGGGGDNIALGERFRDRGFKNGLIDDFRVFNRELSAIEALATFDEAAAMALLRMPSDQLDEPAKTVLFSHFLTADQAWNQHLAELLMARTELAKTNDGLREIMVMKEMAQSEAGVCAVPRRVQSASRRSWSRHACGIVTVSCRRSEESTWARKVDHGSQTSADRARHGESCLAEYLWPRAGQDVGRFWKPGIAAGVS